MWEFMVDLETMSTASNGAIVAIGCVAFDPEKGELHPAEFSMLVDLQSCVDAGLQVDGSTVMWWLQQTEAARAELFSGGKESLTTAMFALDTYIRCIEPDTRAVKMWGNGASFDNVLLSNAFKTVCGLQQPWKFWNDRCYRTMKAVFPQVPQPAFIGTPHCAVDDARHQARHLIEIFKYIRRPNDAGGESKEADQGVLRTVQNS